MVPGPAGAKCRVPQGLKLRLDRAAMDLMYFKRYRMEISLAGRDLAPPQAPPGYGFEPWNPALLDAFAAAKYAAFRSEMDANVFPCLGELDGCRRLMREIVHKPGFLPQTTWLLTCSRPGKRPEYCGTVQGIRDTAGLGAAEPGDRAGASQ